MNAETMQSAELNELATALAKAQASMTHAAKSSDNPFFKSKYADLAECCDAVRKPLTDNGLSVVHSMTDAPEGHVAVVATLLHSSGQWMRSVLTLKPVKADPQAYGSAITYGRRYTLAAITGLAQADDDGNAASGRRSQADNGRTTPSTKATTPAGRVKSALCSKPPKGCGIDFSDTDTLDAVVEWATDAGYRSYADATRTDGDAQSVCDAMVERWEECGKSFDQWVNTALGKKQSNELDEAFRDTVGSQEAPA